MRKIAVARFCRTLSTLLASGVSILEALDITARTSGNAVIEEGDSRPRARASSAAKRLPRPLRETNVFPSMVVQMIGVGEATGALDTMLGEDCGLLRRRSGRCGRRAADAARADHDCAPRRCRRRHRHRDVHADLRLDQQDDRMILRSAAAHADRRPRRCQHAAAGMGGAHSVEPPGLFPGRPVLLSHRLDLRAERRLSGDAALTPKIMAGSSICSSPATPCVVSAFIHVTGGVTSYFSSLYVLPIIAASSIRFGRTAIQVATLSAVLYLALVTAQYVPHDYLPGAAAEGDASRSICRRSASRSTPCSSICSGSWPWRGCRSRCPRASNPRARSSRTPRIRSRISARSTST